MGRKVHYVKFKCDGCGKTVERYPNAKVHYGADHKLCGRLRRVQTRCTCPKCGHTHRTPARSRYSQA